MISLVPVALSLCPGPRSTQTFLSKIQLANNSKIKIFTSEVRCHKRETMKPTKHLSICWHVIKTDDGLGIQVVLNSNKWEAKYNQEWGDLMVQFKNSWINDYIRVLEPLSDTFDEWQFVRDRTHYSETTVIKFKLKLDLKLPNFKITLVQQDDKQSHRGPDPEVQHKSSLRMLCGIFWSH